MALADSSALVTGASSGIGEATATALAREGADVVLAARSEDRLESLAADLTEEFGVRALAVPTDVRDEAAVETCVSDAVDAFGGLDVVVANAGVGRGDDVVEMTTEQYRQMMRTNVDGVFFLVRAALPHLRERAGTLVVVGSFAGQYPRSYNPVYAATKWWVRGFAHSVAASESRRTDGTDETPVGVTVVNPSEVRTQFGSEEGDPFAERYGPAEAVEPEEVADAVVFAARQDHAAVSELDLYRRDKFELF